ncbi:MAG TPA: SMP-30/gluconolactonase/LRE family protein [Streptosporangiaceae bacterium]|jgi:sugar lactone lactonase YvrE
MHQTIDPSQAEPVGDVVAELGEGPLWNTWGPAGATLQWVDIPGGKLHRTVPSSGQTVTTDLGAPVSAVLPMPDGRVIVSRRDRLVVLETDDTERALARVSLPHAVRFNDGATDPQGRVWIGSMDTEERSAVGILYRLDAGGVLTPVVTGVTVSNGLGWSPDGATLYYVDSPTRQIDALDFDPGTGTVAGRRRFADLTSVPGLPDGLTVDTEGGVWVALHGGGVLHRYGPGGRLDTVVSLPVSHPTSCAFGGPDLADLYVTTASAPLSAAERAAQPLAGRLLRLRPGPAGIPLAAADLT